MMKKPLVGIVMGSDSDLPIMKDAYEIMKEFEIECEVIIASAHRVPEMVHEYAETAEAKGIEVIIAGAGAAAHLAGVIAAETTLPVIGVPIRTSGLGGLDSLYSIVQMPSGIPVATVAINGAKNAAILAAQIIGVKDAGVRQKLREYKKKLAENVQAKAKKLEEIGVEAYLSEMQK